MIFLTTKPILKADITEPFIVSNFQYKAKVLQFFFSQNGQCFGERVVN